MGMMNPNADFSHMEAFSTNFRKIFPLQQSKFVVFGWNLRQPQQR